MMERNLEEAEEKEPKTELVYAREVGTCRCSEFEERSKIAEARCLELESEAQKRKSEYEALETRVRTLEASKLALEDEVKILKSRNNEVGDRIRHNNDNETVVGYGGKGLIEGVVDLTEENDEEEKNFELEAINKALEWEKTQAENAAEEWKQKFKELESSMSLLQKSLAKSAERESTSNANDMPAIDEALNFTDSVSTLISPGKGTGTPLNDTPYKGFTSYDGNYSMRNMKQVKRPLSFQEERSPVKQMAASTPAGVKSTPVGIIDVHDSDDELNSADNPSTSKREDVDENISSRHELEGTVDSENETRIIGDTISLISVTKRKRASNVVTSDTESDDDDDDDVPIGKLRRMYCKEVVPAATTSRFDNGRSNFTPRKRRLVSLRQSEEVKKHISRKNNGSTLCKGTPTTKDVEDDNPDEIGLDSESDSDSLNGFIVEDDENIDCDDNTSESQYDSGSNDDHSGLEDVFSAGGSEDVSNDEVDFNEILSQLRRDKDRKSDWKSHGELLAAFGKDPEPCMRAVCALYRQQTPDEKLSKEALHYNGRGFSKFDAGRYEFEMVTIDH